MIVKDPAYAEHPVSFPIKATQQMGGKLAYSVRSHRVMGGEFILGRKRRITENLGG
jgi:hypothetical protein